MVAVPIIVVVPELVIVMVSPPPPPTGTVPNPRLPDAGLSVPAAADAGRRIAPTEHSAARPVAQSPRAAIGA